MICTPNIQISSMRGAREVHHIDTSVILEPKRTEDGYCCYKYTNLVGYKYFGKVSIFVLGELYLKALSFLDYSERKDFLEVLDQFFRQRKVLVARVAKEIDELSLQVKQIDERIDTIDRLILANAAAEGATLVTIDRKLVGNEVLEKAFGIKIVHPKYRI